MQDIESHWTARARARSVSDALARRALESTDMVERSLKQMNADWSDLAKLLADLTGTQEPQKYAECFSRMLQFRDALRTKIRQAPNPARPVLSSRIIRKI